MNYKDINCEEQSQAYIYAMAKATKTANNLALCQPQIIKMSEKAGILPEDTDILQPCLSTVLESLTTDLIQELFQEEIMKSPP